jgi:hypothetical protein
MAKPFDATTKELLEADPPAWLNYLGLHPIGPVEVIDAELSTVTAEADKVYRVGGPEPYLVHVEMQSSPDATLPRRLLRYNALLDYRHDLRVWSVAVLLRPAADGPALTGSLGLRLPDGRPVHDFRFGVVRAWEQSAEAVLNGPVSLLPMALLADAPPEAARSVVERIGERLQTEAPVVRAVHLMTSTIILAGLRFEDDVMKHLFSGVPLMDLLNWKILKDSSGTRLLMKMGKIEEARTMIVAMGTVRFGPITPEVTARIEAIDDLSRLEALGVRLLSVQTWDELLASETTA